MIKILKNFENAKNIMKSANFFCFILYKEKMLTQHHEKLKQMMGAKRPKSLVYYMYLKLKHVNIFVTEKEEYLA